MTHYNFVTIWKFDAPLEKVWEEIKDIMRWPEWWKQVVNVDELASGNTDGVNGIYRLAFKSLLPYKIEFQSRIIATEKFRLIEANVTGGLLGKGKWSFSTENGYTIVRYDWIVQTTKPWMNIVAPVARPVFVWSHNYVMKKGGESLAKRLNCKLHAP